MDLDLDFQPGFRLQARKYEFVMVRWQLWLGQKNDASLWSCFSTKIPEELGTSGEALRAPKGNVILEPLICRGQLFVLERINFPSPDRVNQTPLPFLWWIFVHSSIQKPWDGWSFFGTSGSFKTAASQGRDIGSTWDDLSREWGRGDLRIGFFNRLGVARAWFLWSEMFKTKVSWIW